MSTVESIARPRRNGERRRAPTASISKESPAITGVVDLAFLLLLSLLLPSLLIMFIPSTFKRPVSSWKALNLRKTLLMDNLFLIVQLHFSKLFLILKSGVNHTSRGSISTSTLPSIKLRKCSSKIITSILSFISGRLATKSNQIKQLIRNGRSASLQRTFKKSFTSFSHSTRNKTRDGLIR